MITGFLYILYAFVQAILFIRYVDSGDARANHTTGVILSVVSAPLLSIVLLWLAFDYAITWLVTYKR